MKPHFDTGVGNILFTPHIVFNFLKKILKLEIDTVQCYFSYFSRNKYLRDYVYFSSNWLRSRNDYNCDINALLDLRIESRSLSHYNDVLFN